MCRIKSTRVVALAAAAATTMGLGAPCAARADGSGGASPEPFETCASAGQYSWQCSVYDPANHAAKRGVSHRVNGIQLVPNAPGWDPNAPGLNSLYREIRASLERLRSMSR